MGAVTSVAVASPIDSVTLYTGLDYTHSGGSAGDSQSGHESAVTSAERINANLHRICEKKGSVPAKQVSKDI